MLEVVEDLWRRLVRKHDSKFFSAVTISVSASSDPSQPGGHEPQDFVARVMSVGVIESLEVINVDHGDGIGGFEALQRVVEGASGRQTG